MDDAIVITENIAQLRESWVRTRVEAGLSWTREHLVGPLADLTTRLRYVTAG